MSVDNSTFFNAPSLKGLSAFIAPDEELLMAIPGVIHGEQQGRGKARPQRTSASGMVLVSDTRLICYSRSAFGATNFEGFVYNGITSIQFRRGVMGFGTLDINVGIAKKEITAMRNELGIDIVNFIQPFLSHK